MLSKLIYSAVAATPLFYGYGNAAKVTNPTKVPKNAILLSQVQSLTFYGGKQTASRRVSPVPQAQCVGPPNVCSLYSVDVIRCTNEGAGYDAENIQWSCKASLPEEFKLGSTDVICEGYASSEDPYVLKGSCGVEYRLLLTDKGEAKYAKQKGFSAGHDSRSANDGEFVGVAFGLVFAVVLIIILYKLVVSARNGPPREPRAARPPYGGHDGGGNDDDDPPPPYDSYPRNNYGTAKKKSAPRTSGSTSTRGSSSRTQQQGWRPGFWTGTAAGAAAGYMAGNRGNNRTRTQPETREQPSSRGLFGRSTGGNAGPSSWQAPSPPSSAPSYSSTTHESTGFGSTRRR
jgi:hypothetical protein